MRGNYYISSFVWSTVGKILNAVVNFFSIPLLIGLWGQANYGVLALATACNGYMHLMDMGLNTGAVRYFSIWISEGKIDLLHRVANSNTLFYSGVAIINMLCLCIIALWGENWFQLTHEQFLILRTCLFILAIFSIPTWIATSFNQLLIANKQITYTQQIYCLTTILKAVLIAVTIVFKISLGIYYIFFTAIVAFLFIPYLIKCIKYRLIGRIHLNFYWNDFKPVLVYSISLFALSIFQVTATQSRPIILGIFSSEAANTLTEYRIIEVIPIFILTVGGSITNILLPKSSALVANHDQKGIEQFVYNGTRVTSILACCLTFPFIIGASEILSAYVGVKYSYLAKWLILWVITVLIQIHTTPGNTLILATGHTRPLVLTSAIACIISIVINGVLCRFYGVGSAVTGYFVYVIIVIGSYYVIYYKSLLTLNRLVMFKAFALPTLCALISFVISTCIWSLVSDKFDGASRFMLIVQFIIQNVIWLIFFGIVLSCFGLIKIANHKLQFK